MVEEVADAVVRGDDLHWDHRIFVVWRGEDAGEECDGFRGCAVVVVVAVVAEGSMTEGEQPLEGLADTSPGK